tara:strand:- start:555 stop:1259 length:705 start_codon:yes stop_codon:yes gene_type:complete
MFSKILKLSNIIVVNSIYFKKELKSKFNVKSKCIYNPLNKREILSLSKKSINFKFYEKDSLNLISVGRLVDQKDHITILKAINNIKDQTKLRLLIVGEGKNKKDLIEYINQNQLNKIVKIKDRIDNPFPYLKKAEIMILASKYEGLPNVLLEAISLKKFIISSNCPTGPKEILDNGKGGFLFNVGNYIKLSKMILIYKNNKKIYSKMKRISYQRLDRFNLEKNLDKYYELFKNL